MTASETWNCIENCGACCKLSPTDREDAIAALSENDQKLFFSMVGEDGWCLFYNKQRRKCNIYSTRPYFCNIKSLIKLFDKSPTEFDMFAIKCCKQHIKDIYGSRSNEMKRFIKSIRRKHCYND